MMHNILEKFQLFIQVNAFKNKSSNRKKNATYFQHLPQKNRHTTPPLLTGLPPEFQQLFSPHLLIKKKIDSLQFKKGEGIENKA